LRSSARRCCATSRCPWRRAGKLANSKTCGTAPCCPAAPQVLPSPSPLPGDGEQSVAAAMRGKHDPGVQQPRCGSDSSGLASPPWRGAGRAGRGARGAHPRHAPPPTAGAPDAARPQARLPGRRLRVGDGSGRARRPGDASAGAAVLVRSASAAGPLVSWDVPADPHGHRRLDRGRRLRRTGRRRSVPDH